MSSRSFGDKGPARPHLVKPPSGLKGEVFDLRRDIDSAFVSLETEVDGLGAADLTDIQNAIDALQAGASTDNAVARWSGTGGDTLEASGVLIDDSDNITTAGTVNGRDVSADGTKLDGIESGADVTDATNVAAAGAVMDSDFSGSATGVLRRTGVGTYSVRKDNLAASASPGTSDDDSAGYTIGSVWIDTTADTVWVCVDATTSSAVWHQTDASGSGVAGPGASTDTAVALWNGTGGDTIKNSTVTIDGSGNIATSGTVDGRDLSTDGTKLDGIESGADVTDDTNVRAALAAATADISVNSHKITSLSSGTSSTDAANFGQVTAVAFPTPVIDSSTSRSLSDSDNGKTIYCTNASGISITIPDTLTAGFSCAAVKTSAGGNVTWVAGGTTGLVSVSSRTVCSTSGGTSGVIFLGDVGGSSIKAVLTGHLDS